MFIHCVSLKSRTSPSSTNCSRCLIGISVGEGGGGEGNKYELWDCADVEVSDVCVGEGGGCGLGI